MSLILQKHGEVEGWILESDGFFDTGNFRAKLPTRIRTKGRGSIEGFFSQVLMGGLVFFFSSSSPQLQLKLVNYLVMRFWDQNKEFTD